MPCILYAFLCYSIMYNLDKILQGYAAQVACITLSSLPYFQGFAKPALLHSFTSPQDRKHKPDFSVSSSMSITRYSKGLCKHVSAIVPLLVFSISVLLKLYNLLKVFPRNTLPSTISLRRRIPVLFSARSISIRMRIFL